MLKKKVTASLQINNVKRNNSFNYSKRMVKGN